jgi:hypothetical protein
MGAWEHEMDEIIGYFPLDEALLRFDVSQSMFCQRAHVQIQNFRY